MMKYDITLVVLGCGGLAAIMLGLVWREFYVERKLRESGVDGEAKIVRVERKKWTRVVGYFIEYQLGPVGFPRRQAVSAAHCEVLRVSSVVTIRYLPDNVAFSRLWGNHLDHTYRNDTIVRFIISAILAALMIGYGIFG